MKIDSRRTVAMNQKSSESIKKHFKNHPEHKTAISDAQKNKWKKYKKAIQYCKDAGIILEGD